MNPLKPADIAALSHLLDDAQDLPPEALESWLAALPPSHAHLAGLLREHLKPGDSRPTLPELSFPRLRELPPVGGHCGEQVGPYRLVRELGRGGMGVVWLAERLHGQVRQPAALKMPLVMLDTPARVERFEREREVLALLSHARIARLLDAGITAEGRPYLVMEYVPGLPIHQACDHDRLGLEDRIRLFLQVLDAVDHAHRHLIVHRDIKPSNLIVGPDGQVKLLDFGIAKLLQGAPLSGSALTQEGALALTAAYAAPEQFEGGPVSTATDIHALGVLLYELLTGTLPHPRHAEAGLLDMRGWLGGEARPASQAALDDAAAARRGFVDAMALRAALRGDLETILQKALRQLPAERYSSAERFAEDLQRFLAHQPILARPPSWRYRTGLLLRRHRAVAVAAGTGLLVAATLGVLGWSQHLQEVEQRARAEQVREFLFDMVEDAEPGEDQAGGEITGRQMVRTSVQRARERFAARPRLMAELLAELAHMLDRLGDNTQAARLQREAFTLLQVHAPAGDGALNQLRARIAQQVLASGDAEGAQALATEAVRLCQEGVSCTKARNYAELVLCNAALRQGRTEAALEHMRLSVQAGETAFGAAHAETALGLAYLATVQRQAGDYEGAQASLQRALAIAAGTPLRRADRLQILRMDAVLRYDTGDYAGARAALAQLRMLPADPQAQATLWRLAAHVEFADGDLGAAAGAAARVEALVPAAPGAIERVLVRQLRARIDALEGRTARAATELEGVAAQLREAGYAPSSMEVLRAQRLHAEARLRGGDAEGALQELAPLARAQEAAGPAQLLELAQTLDLTGNALTAAGRPAEALGWHDKARRLYAQRLAAAHPALLRNAVYQAAAGWRATASAAADTQLRDALKAYQARFPGGSVWREQAARSVTHAAACRGVGTPDCLPLL